MTEDSARDTNDGDEQTTTDNDDTRAGYEAPRLTKKRSVSRVTLFTGSGATGTGVTNM